MVDIGSFNYASFRFSDLVNKEFHKNRKLSRQEKKRYNFSKKEMDNLFGIAALAIAELKSLDYNYIERLEEDRTIPHHGINQVINWAENDLYMYFFDGHTNFDSNDYEDLGHVCHTVYILYKENVLHGPCILKDEENKSNTIEALIEKYRPR